MTRKEIDELAKIVAKTPAKSAWNKGVRETAKYLLWSIQDMTNVDLKKVTSWRDMELKMWDGAKKWSIIREITNNVTSLRELELKMLNGAKKWMRYARDGNALIYNNYIAQLFCTPSQLRRTKYGELPPNESEDWMDVYVRGLYQAAKLIERCYNLLF